jgi:molybdopterin-containing oxidoreductase family membrane subunit
MRHLDNMGKVMLATGLIVTYGYIMEAFMAWYGGNPYEMHEQLYDRPFGSYSTWFRLLILCNCIIPGTLLWFPAVRRNVWMLWVLSLVVNVGMWLERFIIVVSSLHEDFLPAAWGMYYPTIWDWATYFGTIGLFLALLFLFLRFLPVISIFEMRELVVETKARAERQEAAVEAAG